MPTAGGHSAEIANDTDVMFAQMMLAHHDQTLRIVDLAQDKTLTADVKTLVAAIEVTELEEAKTLAAWLRGWNKPSTTDPAAHAGHGGAPQSDPKAIDALAAATAADFEAALLNTLIAHQHGAVELARFETAGGVNPGARDLADRIDRSRTAEIGLMLTYLAP